VKNIYTMHHTSNKTESTNYVLFGLWCQQFGQYQHNEQSPFTSNHRT